MASDSLITTLLRQKRFKNNLSNTSDEDLPFLDPSNATPPTAVTNPLPGIMTQQPSASIPQMQPYSPLEMLLMKLGLINNIQLNTPQTAATRG